MLIKRIEQDDLIDCAKEMIEAFKVSPWNENWSIEQAYQRFDEIMSAKNSLGYCMKDEKGKVICTVVGRVMTYLDEKDYNIDDLSVLPDYQGKGIGSIMLDYIKNDLKNVQYISLLTRKGYPSVKFYEKNGIQIDEEDVWMRGKIR